MEVLSFTVWGVIILGVVGIIVLNARAEAARVKGESSRTLRDVAPSFARLFGGAQRWFGSTRQPVHPMTPEELTARIKRGFKTALTMLFALVFLSCMTGGTDLGLTILIYATIPGLGVALVVSLVHTVLLRSLPFRGPVMSSVVGALVGLGAALLLQYARGLEAFALVPIVAIYGVAIGVVEMAVADNPQ